MFEEYRPDIKSETIENVKYGSLQKADINSTAKLIHQREQNHSIDYYLNKLEKEFSVAEKSIDHHLFVAKVNSKIVGFSRLLKKEDENWYLMGVIVDSEYRRKGIASRLVEIRINLAKVFAKKVCYFVNSQNKSSIDLHEKFNFKYKEKIDSIFGIEFTGGEGKVYTKELNSDYKFLKVNSEHFKFLDMWQSKEHLKEFWIGESNHGESYEKYIYKSKLDYLEQFIIEYKGVSIGYIQYYWASKVGQGWWEGYPDDVIGIDQYIGDEKYLGQGHGQSFLKLFIETLFKVLPVNKIIVDPSPKNFTAINCFEKVGFNKIGEIITPDGNALLMDIHRANCMQKK